MKIVVISDSHGHSSRIEEVLKRQVKPFRVFFLGDGLADILKAKNSFPDIEFDIVCGNCDSLSEYPDVKTERLVECEGVRFLLMHGHKHGVKGGIGGAVNYAASKGADVLLFGHTHEAFDEPIDASAEGSDGTTVRAINPGSVGAWFGASFALLDLLPDGTIVCSFGGES